MHAIVLPNESELQKRHGVTHADVSDRRRRIIGSCTAYFLKKELGFRARSMSSSATRPMPRPRRRSPAASIRQQFSTPENIRMSRFGIEVIRGLKDRFGADADIGFREAAISSSPRRAGAPCWRPTGARRRRKARIPSARACRTDAALPLEVHRGHRAGAYAAPARAGSTPPCCSTSSARRRARPAYLTRRVRSQASPAKARPIASPARSCRTARRAPAAPSSSPRSPGGQARPRHCRAAAGGAAQAHGLCG